MVIEEFCRYGNIHDYSIANRDSFVNELDEITGELKPLDEKFILPHNYQTQNQYKRFFSFLIRSIFIRNSAYHFHFSYFQSKRRYVVTSQPDQLIILDDELSASSSSVEAISPIQNTASKDSFAFRNQGVFSNLTYYFLKNLTVILFQIYRIRRRPSRINTHWRIFEVK